MYSQDSLSIPESQSGSLGGTVHGGAQGERSDLPCLYSNNSTEAQKLEQIKALAGILSPYHKRAAHTLYSNVSRLITISESESHIGFLTLTFPDNVKEAKEAYNRFRSFNSHFLSDHPEFGEWLAVKERQKRGAWHYHLLIQTKDDIKSGLSFAGLEKGDYSSANPYLKFLWNELRQNLPKYGLGRSELLPIKSNQEAMSRYLGKYISKHLGKREAEDKGVRLVNYSRGWTRNSVQFAWYNENSQEWRRKVKTFANLHGCPTMYALKIKLGPNWAYNFADVIYRIDDVVQEQNTEVPF